MNTIAKAFSVAPVATLFVVACVALACVMGMALAWVAMVDKRQARALDAYIPSESTIEHESAPATVNLRNPTSR